MRTGIRCFAVTAALLSVAACNGSESEDAGETPATVADTAMAMPGMPGMMANTGMMAGMKNHMAMMQGISADSMKAMVAMHRQMAANMLADMNRQMRAMNMAADAAWNAVADSVRADLNRMPDMSGAELQAFMADHQRRLTRLMEMHTTMMKNMRM